MSIRINNKIIAGNSSEAKSTSYRYVGEIFQSAIPIDDIKVACLDGHKIYSDEGYGSFVQYLISQSLIYPQIVCTEEEWQEKVGQYGSWGKFVINTQENSVRLPKIAGFVQGLNTLEDLSGLLEAGLPNIEGSWAGVYNSIGISGAVEGTFKDDGSMPKTQTVNESSKLSALFDINASRSSAIYGNSDTVQPQAIQYPYYIVLATGVVQEINIKDEVHLNNPFFFGMYQYFETEPNNLSWLKSEGQWNIGDIYESFYKWLVESYNNTDSGVSVKLHTETYTNFDYVLNQDNKTFRLPIEVKQKFYNDISGSIPVAGNGMTLGLTDGSLNYGFQSINQSQVTPRAMLATGSYGKEVGTAYATSYADINNTVGVTTDPTKSGIEAQITQTEIEGLGLYFYVGEVVEGAKVINGKKVLDILPKKLEKEDIYKGITNCLLEVPQNIKLELNDGVLTLKAGSQVIVPNGFEEDGVTPKFDYVTVESDIINTDISANEETVFMWNPYQGGSIGGWGTKFCFSGPTAPDISAFDGWGLWYDTSTNLIKEADGDGIWVRPNPYALPFCIATSDTDSKYTINQVFNGFGYIGSTVWIDKGVKVLIPNGRNENGTLNNIEAVTNKVVTKTVASATNAPDHYIMIGADGGIYGPTTIEAQYNETLNVNTYQDNVRPWTIVGYIDITKGAMSNLRPKTTFRAVDYNDIQSLMSSGGSSGGEWEVVGDNTSGYMKHTGNGFMIQWFYASVNVVMNNGGSYISTGKGTITYPYPFNTACYSITSGQIVSTKNIVLTYNTSTAPNDITKTTYTFQCNGTANGTDTLNGYYIAMGF